MAGDGYTAVAYARVVTPARGKLMATLFAAQVCGSAGHSMTMAVGSIMAASVTGTNTWSGLAVAVAGLGAALGSWPLSRLMDRSGLRRPGLVLGYVAALVGAVLGIVAVMTRSFPLLLVTMALLGVSNSSNLLARYAAADISPGAQRGRAMGLIVWGSAAGSMIGPNLMALSVAIGGVLAISPTASPFLISLAGFALSTLITAALLRPDPLAIARAHAAAETGRSTAVARSLRAALGDVRVQIAFAALAINQFVTLATTSTSPVYLHDQGHSVRTIGIAVSLHLGGMYVTSPLSGWLSDRCGRLPIIVAGALVLIGAVVLAGVAPGTDGVLVIAGLFLNGVGWNMVFVAASALLTDALSATERASIQGFADLAMGLMGALGSTAGGMILGIWGFAILNAVGAAVVLAPLAASLLRRPALASKVET